MMATLYPWTGTLFQSAIIPCRRNIDILSTPVSNVRCCPSSSSSHSFASLSKTLYKCSCNIKAGKNLVICIDGTSNTMGDVGCACLCDGW
ncbi:hypothetical protein BDR07DRAFT_586936 [Suillus spraguei]|nr:hypothetical protein BDR07DRAFT_586936 [Suillus spraguei]